MGVTCVKSDTGVATPAYQDHSYYVPIVKMIPGSISQIVAFYVEGGEENMAGSRGEYGSFPALTTLVLYCQNVNPAVHIHVHVHVFKYVCVSCLHCTYIYSMCTSLCVRHCVYTNVCC